MMISIPLRDEPCDITVGHLRKAALGQLITYPKNG
jgi:hypothetical protein